MEPATPDKCVQDYTHKLRIGDGEVICVFPPVALSVPVQAGAGAVS